MKIKNNRTIFAAFALPVLLMIAAFAVEGIYPFGDNQIAVIDMYHQYVPFISELQNKLQEGGSLLFTWDGAGGCNFLALLAYYGASPLNLLLLIFPESLIMEAMTLILLIKIGLAGSFMAIFLRYAHGRCDMGTLAFATMYALCSYVMAYYWCIMWMDAVALLPLCVMGLHKLIGEGKFVQYTICIALTVFINYYVAMMVCIFILFYYPVLYFTKVRNGGRARCILTTAKAVGFSLLGVAMSAVMLIPVRMSMQNTYYISSEMPDDWYFYDDILDVMNQLLPNAALTFREGLPNVYCGLLAVILLAFYILSKTVTLREKTLNISLLVFMLLSLNINKLDFIWHGLHFPNQLPYRYSFVICFLLICIAYRAFLKVEEVSVNVVWGVLAVGIGYYVFAQKLLRDIVDDPTLFVYGGIAWLVLYCVVVVLYKKNCLKRSSFVFLILVVMISEMASNTCTSVDKVGTTVRSEYFSGREDIMELAEQTKEEFVRTEMVGEYVLNCPALYHYRGISQFSSSINANTTEFMEKIGVEGDPEKNRFNYNGTAPILNAILGIKYIMCDSSELDDENFTQIKVQGSAKLYENNYDLPMGYMVDDAIRTWDCDSGNPFDVLDDYVRAVTNNESEGVFRSIGNPKVSNENIYVSEAGDGRLSEETENESASGKVGMSYTAKETQEYYIFIEAENASTIMVRREDGQKDVEIKNDCGSIVGIGEIKEGETFDVDITYEAGDCGDVECQVKYMDEDVWKSTYSLLSENTMTFTQYDDTQVTGTIDARKSGTCIISIPYEDGWHMRVDGREVEISELVGGCFISTSLDAGTHEIELYYRPPGLVAGLMTTLLAIAVLVACALFSRHKKIRSARGRSVHRELSGDPGEVSDYI